ASTLAKPAASTVTVYVPGGSWDRRYSPSTFNCVERSTPFAALRTVTVALVTRLAFSSRTVTRKSPVATPCARVRRVVPKRNTQTDRVFEVNDISSPLRAARNDKVRKQPNAELSPLAG